jgi:hypothetical protein
VSGALRPVVNSYLSESYAPFNWLPIDRLRNPLQPQDIASRGDPEVQRDSLCGLDDTDPLRSTPERKAITWSKLDDVWDVTATGVQTGKTAEDQYDLFKSERGYEI